STGHSWNSLVPRRTSVLACPCPRRTSVLACPRDEEDKRGRLSYGGPTASFLLPLSCSRPRHPRRGEAGPRSRATLRRAQERSGDLRDRLRGRRHGSKSDKAPQGLAALEELCLIWSRDDDREVDLVSHRIALARGVGLLGIEGRLLLGADAGDENKTEAAEKKPLAPRRTSVLACPLRPADKRGRLSYGGRDKRGRLSYGGPANSMNALS